MKEGDSILSDPILRSRVSSIGGGKRSNRVSVGFDSEIFLYDGKRRDDSDQRGFIYC